MWKEFRTRERRRFLAPSGQPKPPQVYRDKIKSPLLLSSSTLFHVQFFQKTSTGHPHTPALHDSRRALNMRKLGLILVGIASWFLWLDFNIPNTCAVQDRARACLILNWLIEATRMIILIVLRNPLSQWVLAVGEFVYNTWVIFHCRPQYSYLGCSSR